MSLLGVIGCSKSHGFRKPIPHPSSNESQRKEEDKVFGINNMICSNR